MTVINTLTVPGIQCARVPVFPALYKSTILQVREQQGLIMKKYLRHLLIGFVLAAMLVVPVSAESVYTRFENGSILIHNGSYWMYWEPVGNHTVGDRFFANGTTNLPAGSVIYCQFIMYGYTQWNIPGTADYVVIEPGSNAGNNTFSCSINTTGLHDDCYFLFFDVCPFNDYPSSYSDICQHFPDGEYFVNRNITLSAAETPVITSPLLSLSVFPVCGALFLSLCLVRAIRRKKQR